MGRSNPSAKRPPKVFNRGPGTVTRLIHRPARITSYLKVLLGVALVGCVALVVWLAWLAWQLLNPTLVVSTPTSSPQTEPPRAPTRQDAPSGPWEPVMLPDKERAANDGINAQLPQNWITVGPNKVDPRDAAGVKEIDSPIVAVKFPGKNRQGQPQVVRVRQEAARQLVGISDEIQQKLGLTVRWEKAWTTHAAQKAVRDAVPALECSSAHLVDAVDIDLEDADGKQPLTLGVDGRPILLKDLETPSGMMRFAEVVRRIAKEELAANPGKQEEIIQAWIRSAREDLRNGVWGVPDATMEIWRGQGWSVGHCGVLPYRSWHAQRSGTAPRCERWNDDYNRRLKAYRQAAPPSPRYIQRSLEILAADGPFFPYVPTDAALGNLAAVNATLPWDYPFLSFNRVNPRLAALADELDAPLVELRMRGHDRQGNAQRALARLPTAQLVQRVADDVRDELGLELRVSLIWLDNATQKRLHDADPQRSKRPGESAHMLAAVNVARADAFGKNPLTLDLDNNVLLLDALKTPSGAQRFKAVVRRILGKDLKKIPPRKQAKVLDLWVKSAAKDLESGVWGMQDVTMEVWKKHDWAVGHCGEDAQESWHAEPIKAMQRCVRFSDTYNSRLLTLKKKSAVGDRAVSAPDSNEQDDSPKAQKPRKGSKRKRKK